MNKTGRNNWKVLLIPFSWLYGLVIWVRNNLYDTGFLKSAGFNIPLISVGNITAGGTGKTPHVEYLAELLQKDFRVATLSRGYKRSTRDFRIAGPESSVQEIGDEPLQMKRRFPGITVAVDRNRSNGIQLLMKEDPSVEVILLDDAYQHRSVKPGFSILLVDYTRPIGKDHLLPAGMLREPARNLHRANIVLVTRSPERIKPLELRQYANETGLTLGQHLYFTSMRYGNLSPVFPAVRKKDAAWFKHYAGGVLIVSGIARPRPLRQYARSINTNIRELSFPDHHPYSGRDLEKISRNYREFREQHGEILVLTTEKDAVRLRGLNPEVEWKEAMYAVRIHVHFLNDDKDEFDRQIWNYVNSNKRSSLLYQGADS
ncbi:MAG: tetraacyldisaccharide 4'-kinase [Bacteroidales bacterium]|nr:tetraacyldisaccharide 4'-kinase [Bacteroidales bacterium]